MTAEETALTIVSRLMEISVQDAAAPTWAMDVKDVASAIRAAEQDAADEALERAASDVDWVKMDAPQHGDWHSACRYVAKRIRSLKTKTGGER